MLTKVGKKHCGKALKKYKLIKRQFFKKYTLQNTKITKRRYKWVKIFTKHTSNKRTYLEYIRKVPKFNKKKNNSILKTGRENMQIANKHWPHQVLIRIKKSNVGCSNCNSPTSVGGKQNGTNPLKTGLAVFES